VSPAAFLPTLLATSAVLSRARFPQTTTEPASAAMRAAGRVLAVQSAGGVLALAIVLGLLLLAALRLRTRQALPVASPPAAPERPRGRLWALAPWLLVALVALPALAAALMAALRPRAAPTDVLRVNVVGHRWWWEFTYPDRGVFTASEVHVPVGHPVRFVIETADVEHALWIPALGPRLDVPPLRRRELTFTPDRVGVYPGQCAELCGSAHAHMRLKLYVDSPVAFDAWLANQQAPRTEPTDTLVAAELWRGQMVFATTACRDCHTVRGLTQGRGGPDLTHFASRSTLAGGMLERSDSTLARWILHAPALKQGSAMPGAALPAQDLKPLVAWLQSLL
jgi:cytochrome c oxidase subunit 2